MCDTQIDQKSYVNKENTSKILFKLHNKIICKNEIIK